MPQVDRVLMLFTHITKKSKFYNNVFNTVLLYLCILILFYRQFPNDLKMSIIDRWATHPLLIKAIGSRISDELKKFPESDRDDVIILFSAHSLPLKVIILFFKLTVIMKLF